MSAVIESRGAQRAAASASAATAIPDRLRENVLLFLESRVVPGQTLE